MFNLRMISLLRTEFDDSTIWHKVTLIPLAD